MRLRNVLIAGSLASWSFIGLAGPASAAPTKVGTETFVLTSDINAEGGVVTASGVINDQGVDIVVSDTQDTFDFGANGQITVFHSPLRSHDKFSEKKCSFSFTEKGTYVFGNGTGEWAGYNGSGTYTAKGQAVDACGDTPVGTVTITAKGPINPPTDDE
jgi:hypothetical protein